MASLAARMSGVRLDRGLASFRKGCCRRKRRGGRVIHLFMTCIKHTGLGNFVQKENGQECADTVYNSIIENSQDIHRSSDLF